MHLDNYTYDGRGFLRGARTPSVDDPPPCPSPTGALFCDGYETGDFACWSSVTGGAPGGSCPWLGLFDEVAPVYSSEGRLHGLDRTLGNTLDRHAVLYFGDRPVALWRKEGTSAATLTYLTTDHLGTPILAMNSSGTATWSGGFEPFGRDFTVPSAESAGLFLRLPGQWDDPIFADSTLGAEAYYNVHRWHETQTARYSSPDPLGLLAGPNLFAYVSAKPLRLIDPAGLADCGVLPEKATVDCLGFCQAARTWALCTAHENALAITLVEAGIAVGVGILAKSELGPWGACAAGVLVFAAEVGIHRAYEAFEEAAIELKFKECVQLCEVEANTCRAHRPLTFSPFPGENACRSAPGG